jgi:acetylornithine deacetylase
MHKGHLRLRLSLRGTSAHSAYPHLGASAIAPAGPAFSALSALGEALAVESPPAGAHFPDVPYVALNIGRIEGGRAVNMVPDACVLDLGLRTLPGTDADRLEERVRETLAPVLPPGRWRLERRGETPPFAGAADSPLYRELAALLGQERPASVAFSTDAGWLATMGLDCVVWGPGSITVAHQPDEHLEERELAAARPLLETVVERFCHGGRPAGGGEDEDACGAR